LNPSPLVFRRLDPASAADLLDWQRVFRGAQSFTFATQGRPPTDADAQRMMRTLPPGRSQDDVHLFAIHAGEELCGVAFLARGYPTADVTYLVALVLMESFQNRSLGPACLARIEDLARSWQTSRLSAVVDSANARALAFWLKHGFHEVRRRALPDLVGQAICIDKALDAGRPMPRLAIAQSRMHWTIEANMASIAAALELASRRGASICTFPELALTGFHREIVALARPGLVAPQVRRLQELCARHAIAAAVGAPTFGADGARYNSHLMIDRSGQLLSATAKNGLTPAEATFFQAGVDRPVSVLSGLRCAAVICREMEDEAEVREQLAPGGVDLVFWPGQMRPDPALPVTEPPAHVARAQRMALALNAHVVQANWPNALNRPEESANTGRSAVISPAGELLFRLPLEASGLAVFALGERSYEWHPGVLPGIAPD
jgi:predicted amidohydrolase/GNAT superfamily N-acetyltransferase